MSKLFLFDPQKEYFKKPFGAVSCDEEIHFSVKALTTFAHSAELCVFSEYEGREDSYPMSWCKREKGYDVYSLSYKAKNTPGIFWYCFKILTTDGQTVFFGKNGITGNKEAVLSFQLTVYADDYVTPSWFSEGVTYHVFVDRFFRATNDKKLLSDDYFYIHNDKNETPLYRPDENGVVENRDIYGGNLAGIKEKLPYLESLGVKTIYLSPVFEAWSNHKYNTADYKKIDSHFGDENELSSLCSAAKEKGIRVILDGVFSHTGSDSIYFNREGRYGTGGAYRDSSSPYREWFDFHGDGKYSSWWGIDTLPQVNELNEAYQSFITEDDDSVIGHWMKAGVSGWRLDVADELPDEFIKKLKLRARKENKNALIIGEVWEDASTKKAYGVNKTYFTDGVLDGVMNYPLKNAILSFLKNEITARQFKRELDSLSENYPEISQRCLMNIIGTHDTVRAVNELSTGPLSHLTKDERAERKLTEGELCLGKNRLRQAAVLQYMFPGSPCIYYGDEIGMQGFEDPFNRAYFKWDEIDEELLDFYRRLGKIKNELKSLKKGKIKIVYARGDVVALCRKAPGERAVLAFINRGKNCKLLRLKAEGELLLNVGKCSLSKNLLKLSQNSCCIFEEAVFS